MDSLNEIQKALLAKKLLHFGDDELILGHRNSEWCGHAPILEEDIAFANLALDEVGHAQLWYQLHASLVDADPEIYPDQLVYRREAYEFRSTHIVALPNGDWAFTMLRQYLFDTAEAIRLAALCESSYRPLAETAAKIRAEEIYHLRHTEAWVKRLALGTEESNRRMQLALDSIWGYTPQLFDALEGEEQLVSAGILVAGQVLYADWLKQVTTFLSAANLTLPADSHRTLSRELQSQHMIDILAELQQVARLDPEAQW